MDISVIIPTYNRANLISQTIQSILAQSSQPAEVIVVDDGSTDGTGNVLRQFGSSIKYIRTENGGQCRARNIGVAASSSEWMAFCDSDDLWHRDKLSYQHRLIEKAPDVEYSFTNFRNFDGDIWSSDTKFNAIPEGFWELPKRIIDAETFVVEAPLFSRILTFQPIFPSTVVMKRRYFEEVGRWEESLGSTVGEDFEFALRCTQRSPIGVVTAPVVGIRKHSGNFSGDDLRIILGDIEILHYSLKRHSYTREEAGIIKEQIQRRSSCAAGSLFEMGDFKKMRQLLKEVPFWRRSWKLHLKSVIARSPDSIGCFLHKNTLALSRKIRSGP